METEKVNVKYSGPNGKCIMPGYIGRLKSGDERNISKELYEKELKDDPRWTLVKNKKEPKKIIENGGND